MRLVSLLALGLALPALPFAACGDSTSGGTKSLIDTDAVSGDVPHGDTTNPDAVGPTAVALETVVSAAQVTAGASVTVTCSAVDADGASVPVSQVPGLTGFEVVALPSAGVTVDGLDVTPTVAGSVELACEGQGADLVDPTPATVTVVAGAPAKTLASLTPPTVTAGESVAAACEVQDAYGNVIADATPTFAMAPADGGDASALPATPTTAGSFHVTCAVAGAEALEQVPATLTVEPAAAVSLTLSATPDQKAYLLGQAITLVGQGEDVYGNTFPVALGEPTVTPDGHHELLANGKLRFNLEGKYVAEAAAQDDPALTASLPLVVDQTPPTLTLLTPDRGLATTDAAVTVTGTVVDNLGEIASLTLGDTEIPVAADGSFTVEAPLAYGINVLELVATDPYDLTSNATRSVLASSTFNAPAPAGLDKAVVLVLAPETIDDGVQDLTQPDDLASIVALMLQQMDFAAFLPDPLVGFSCLGGDCEIRVSQVTYDTPVVTMKLISNAIRLEVSLPNLAGTIQLEVPCDSFLCPSDPIVMPGTFGAQTVILSTEIKVTLAADGTPELAAENTDVEVDGLSVTIANTLASIPVIGPATQGVIDSVVGWMEPGLVTALEVAVPLIVEDQVAGALGGVLEALDIEQELEIPAVVDGASPNTLQITTAMTAIDINPQFMRLELAAGALSVSTPPEGFDPVHVATGSLGYLGCGPMGAVTAPPTDRIAAGLQDDLVNQLLLAVYAGGTLAIAMDAEQAASLDLSQYGIDLKSLTTTPLLPPVLNSCGRDDAGVLQMGDFWVDVELTLLGTESHIGLWVHLEAPFALEATKDEEGATALGLSLGDIALGADVVTNTGTFEGDDAALVALLQDALLPMALESLTDGSLAFTLPAFDLASLDENIPEGTVIGVGVNAIVRNQGYLQVDGQLE